MAEAGWAWGPGVVAALGDALGRDGKPPASRGFDIWNELPEWEERAPRPPAGSLPVSVAEAETRLAELAGADAEDRPGQVAFAGAAAEAFLPRERAGEPHVVIAEAGTGIGKTIGYIAPASLWADRNKGTVWISTYTKNLQRQLDQELTRLYPDPAEKAEKAVIRKGRENYLCLLNFAEMADRAALSGNAVAKWPHRPMGEGEPRRRHGGRRLSGLAGGPAWRRDGTDGAHRPARRMRLHRLPALQEVLHRTGDPESAAGRDRGREPCAGDAAGGARPGDGAGCARARKAGRRGGRGGRRGASGREARSRSVFDEGHHIFDAADSALSASLSALETAELRRWIRGAEGQRGRRGRGLDERVSDLIAAATNWRGGPS